MYTQQGYCYFVTTRLAGALPEYVEQNLMNEYKSKVKYLSGISNYKLKWEKYNDLKTSYFEKFDAMLTKYDSPVCNLADFEISRIVKESFHYRDKVVYDLVSYSIMPNHVHVLFIPIIGRIANSPYIVSKIMQSFKRHTARKINQLLKRKGQFWQHESFDHIVRNYVELSRLVNYTINNPVKAGLTDNPYKWRCNYYNEKYL